MQIQLVFAYDCYDWRFDSTVYEIVVLAKESNCFFNMLMQMISKTHIRNKSKNSSFVFWKQKMKSIFLYLLFFSHTFVVPWGSIKLIFSFPDAMSFFRLSDFLWMLCTLNDVFFFYTFHVLNKVYLFAQFMQWHRYTLHFCFEIHDPSNFELECASNTLLLVSKNYHFIIMLSKKHIVFHQND